MKSNWPSTWGCPWIKSPSTISLSKTMKVRSAKENPFWNLETEITQFRLYDERSKDEHIERDGTVGVLGPGELHLVLLVQGQGLRPGGLEESRVLHPLVVLRDMLLHVRNQYHFFSLQTGSHSLSLSRPFSPSWVAPEMTLLLPEAMNSVGLALTRLKIQ